MATYVDGEAPETDSDEEQDLFNLSYLKIGCDNSLESPNVAINNARDILLKGNVVDGVTETQNLLNTPVATELTEDFNIYPSGEPETPAEFFYANELLRRKIDEESTRIVDDYIRAALAPISKKLRATDASLINTQLTLQNVSTTMTEVNQRTKRINEKFSNLLDCQFLPNIQIAPLPGTSTDSTDPLAES